MGKGDENRSISADVNSSGTRLIIQEHIWDDTPISNLAGMKAAAAQGQAQFNDYCENLWDWYDGRSTGAKAGWRSAVLAL